MRHLLGIEGLSLADFELLLNNSKTFVEVGERDIKKVPTLRGKTIINLFMEASTRTRTSFEIAGKRMSADVINVGSSDSSAKKGETLLDTARTLQAMSPDIVVVRHSESGSALFLSQKLKNASIVNAGDGMHEHPTQALLDCLTISQVLPSIKGIKIAIVGDVLHSRVARSNIFAHLLLGNEIHLVGPKTLVPELLLHDKAFGKYKKQIKLYHSLKEGIKGCDIVMCLRIQMERLNGHFFSSLQEYTDLFCISEKVLKDVAPDCFVMHPGPMNRGVEITTEVADGPRSLIERQVNNGVSARMAVLLTIAAAKGTVDVEGTK